MVHQEADYATAWAGEVLKGGFVPGMYCNFVCAEDVRNALKKGYPPQAPEPVMLPQLHQESPQRFALLQSTATNSSPRQGFALPADAALDPARRLSEDIQYQSEALLRIAQTRGSLLSLWSDFQARKTGSGGP